MVTIILSIAIMFAVAAALSIKVLLGREREVKRFGCGSFSPAGPAGLSGRAGLSEAVLARARRPRPAACAGRRRAKRAGTRKTPWRPLPDDRDDFSRN